MATKKAKRPKYPKLPNGYGSIKLLSGNRRNPFGVYLPAQKDPDTGRPKQTTAIAYVDTWLKGMAVLNAYHAGTFVVGQELSDSIEGGKESDVIDAIIKDFNLRKREGKKDNKLTFLEVYELFYEWKFNDDKSREFSLSARNAYKAALKNYSNLHNKYFCDLVHDDFQREIDNCELSHTSLTNMVVLVHGMAEYSMIYKIIKTNETLYLKIKVPKISESGIPFTNDELNELWNDKENPIAEMLLIMCYSGYRINAYKNMEINSKENYFKGGVKNVYSKDRIVPIHSGIEQLVVNRIKREGYLLKYTVVTFRKYMYKYLKSRGMEKHTPHDCRHTFSKLCEEFGVNENDRKRMLGHSFGNDITNAVYGHRSLDELREQIEKIKICH